MKYSFCINRVSDTLWTSAAVIRILSVSGSMSADIYHKLLSIRKDPGTSFEVLLLSSGKEDKPVDLLLIIRIKGSEPDSVTDKMNNLTGDVTQILKYEGFKTELLSEDEVKSLDAGFSYRKNMLLFYPGENGHSIESFYAPGSYDLTREIDFKYLAAILSDVQDAGISIMIVKTGIAEDEVRICKENVNWLAGKGGRESEEGIRAFRRIADMQDDSAFAVIVTLWGGESSLRLMINSLRNCDYSEIAVPNSILYEGSYINSGDNMLLPHAFKYGHTTPQNISVIRNGSRLNFITDYNGISRIFGRFTELTQIKGVTDNTKNTADTLNEVPDRYLTDQGICIGTVTGTDRPISIFRENLVRHAVIAGMPGSGKTSLMFYLLNELYKKKIPFIAIEPVKTEYRELLDVIPDLKVYTPGKSDVAPFMFNPFLPPKGITLEQYLPSLEEAFSTVLSMTTPLDVIFPEALRNCYAQYGWTNNSTRDSDDVTIFGMHEFINSFRREAMRSNYDDESRQNLISGGSFRLQKLLNVNQYLFDTDKSVSFDDLLSGYTVIELDSIGNPEHKALILTLMMMQLKLIIGHNQKKDSILKNVIMLDEAHEILGGTDYTVKKNEANPLGRIRKYFLEMVRVIRAYGTGMIFSDQSISILEEFVNNADVKVTMHLENAEERRFLAMNLGYSAENYNMISSLSIGEFLLSCGDIKTPVLVQAPDTRKVLSVPEDVSDSQVASKMGIVHQKPFMCCKCKNGCDISVRAQAESLARRLSGSIDNEMLANRESLDKYIRRNLNDALGPMVEGYDNDKKLLRCAAMQFERMISLKTTF